MSIFPRSRTTDSPVVGIENITPQMAAEWLAKYNSKNPRGINQKRVKKYAKLMADGNFHLFAGGITFDIDGNISDGQHRLAAIALSGVSIPLVVLRGAKREAKLGIDQGQKRAVYQQLGIAKELGSLANLWNRLAFPERRAADCFDIGPIADILKPFFEIATKAGGDPLSAPEMVSAVFCLVRAKQDESFGTFDDVAGLVENYRNGQRSPLQNKVYLKAREIARSGSRDEQKFDLVLRAINAFEVTAAHEKNRLPSVKPFDKIRKQMVAILKGGI